MASLRVTPTQPTAGKSAVVYGTDMPAKSLRLYRDGILVAEAYNDFQRTVEFPKAGSVELLVKRKWGAWWRKVTSIVVKVVAGSTTDPVPVPPPPPPPPPPVPSPDPVPPPPTPSPTVPAVVSSFVDGVTQTSATVHWATNIPTTGRVDYGTTTAYGSSSSLDAGYTTGHVKTLTGLTAGTTYHWKAYGQSADAQAYTSGDRTFTTLAADPVPPPTPPPTPPPGTGNVASGLSAAQLQAALIANRDAGRSSILAAGATYTLTSTITLSGAGFYIDLNGATLRWTSNVVGLKLQGTSNFYIKNGTLQGNDSSGVYIVGDEHDHGFHLDGGVNFTSENVTVKHFRGDGYYGNHSTSGVTGNGLRIIGGRIDTVSRMGIGIVNFDNGFLDAVTFAGRMYRELDFEPEWGRFGFGQNVRNWLVQNCPMTAYINGQDGSGTSFLYIGTPYTDPGGGAIAPKISNITVKGCSVTTSAPTPHKFMETDLRSYRASNIRLEGNSSPQTWGRGADCQNVDGLTVINNDVTSTLSPWLVSTGSTNVVASGNG